MADNMIATFGAANRRIMVNNRIGIVAESKPRLVRPRLECGHAGKALGYLHPLAVSDRKGSDSCIDIEIAGIQRLQHCRRLLGGTAPSKARPPSVVACGPAKMFSATVSSGIKAEFLIDRSQYLEIELHAD